MGNGWFRGEEWEKGRKSGKATFLTQNRVDTIARILKLAGMAFPKDLPPHESVGWRISSRWVISFHPPCPGYG